MAKSKKKVTKADGSVEEVEVTTVTVRVKGNQPLLEAGALHLPEHTRPNNRGGSDKVPAATFETTEARALALGDSVELVTE